MSKQEEWNIFSRIENLEEAKEKFLAVEPTSKENRVIAFFAFILGFMALTEHRADFARRFKDTLITQLKGAGLTQRTLNVLEESMLMLCDILEPRR